MVLGVKKLSLSDVAFCSLVLRRPVLITSDSPEKTSRRLKQAQEKWKQESPDTNDCGSLPVAILTSFAPGAQRNLYTQLKKEKYPLLLVMPEHSPVDSKLQSQLLFEYRDDVDTEIGKAFQIDNLKYTRNQVKNITIIPEVRTYIYDLVVELRYSRFVKGGVPTYILFDLMEFIRFRAYLMGMAFVTPLIVKESFKFVLPLRVKLVVPEEDPTLIYGSSPTLVNQLVNGINVHDVIEISVVNVKPPI